jgi:hypothetical protein
MGITSLILNGLLLETLAWQAPGLAHEYRIAQEFYSVGKPSIKNHKSAFTLNG